MRELVARADDEVVEGVLRQQRRAPADRLRAGFGGRRRRREELLLRGAGDSDQRSAAQRTAAAVRERVARSASRQRSRTTSAASLFGASTTQRLAALRDRTQAPITTSRRSGSMSCARSTRRSDATPCSIAPAESYQQVATAKKAAAESQQLTERARTVSPQRNPQALGQACYVADGSESPLTAGRRHLTAFRAEQEAFSPFRRSVQEQSSSTRRAPTAIDHARDAMLARRRMKTGDCRKSCSREAQAHIPGGVNSPVRAWKAVGGTPRFIQRARGSTITDADGNAYIDYVGSWGPMILGHAHPQVLRAVHEAMRDGTSFGAPTPREIELARRIVRRAAVGRAGAAGLAPGTEATMTAIRLARAFTGRAEDRQVRRLLPRPRRRAAGARRLRRDDVRRARQRRRAGSRSPARRWWRASTISTRSRRASRAEGDAIAAVIVEPVVGNMGVVPPQPGFLDGLREHHRGARRAADLRRGDHRLPPRLGRRAERARHPARPDLPRQDRSAAGCRSPRSAAGATSWSSWRRSAAVYQAGTLSGNPLAVAPGWRRSSCSTSPAPTSGSRRWARASRTGCGRRSRRHGRPGCVNRRGSMWTLFFGVDAVRDADDARALRHRAPSRASSRGMLERGIYLPPSQFEAAFISLAHTEDDIDDDRRAPPTRRSRRCAEVDRASTRDRRADELDRDTPGEQRPLPRRSASRSAARSSAGVLLGYYLDALFRHRAAVHAAAHHRRVHRRSARLALVPQKA